MKIIKFVMFLFYKYYSTGPEKEIPYFSTLIAMTVIALLHFLQVLVILNLVDILPLGRNQNPFLRYLKASLIAAPFFIVFLLLFKKEEIINQTFNEKTIKRGYRNLVIYIVLSFILFVLLTILKS